MVKHSDTSESLFRRRSRQPAVRERRLVAVGTVTDANLKSRLHEIFHLDHGKHKVQWVRVSWRKEYCQLLVRLLNEISFSCLTVFLVVVGGDGGCSLSSVSSLFSVCLFF